MKTAPCFVAGLTASAALAAGVLLAAEDRALFEPQHAMLVGLAAEGPTGSALDAHRALGPALRAHDGPRRTALRTGVGAARPSAQP